MKSLGTAANLRSLDALRGILAIYVVCHHARLLLWAGQQRWVAAGPHPIWENALALVGAVFRDGHAAVVAFFVLSGFFIHLRAAQSLAKDARPRVRAGRFYARRLHRLGPPYLFALAFTLALDLIGRHWFPALYNAHSGDNLLDELFRRKGFGSESVFPALFLLPSSLGQDFGSNGPLWSLAFEVVYYTLYPGWLFLRWRAGPTISFAGVGIASALVGPTLSHLAGFLGAVLWDWPLWLMGAALAEALVAGNWRRALPGWMALGVGACWTSDYRAGLAGTALVAATARLPESICRWKPHRLLEILGISSYTLYIAHFPILTLLSARVFATWGERPFSPWLALSGVLLAVVSLRGAYEIFERPFLHVRLRLNDISPRPARTVGFPSEHAAP